MRGWLLKILGADPDFEMELLLQNAWLQDVADRQSKCIENMQAEATTHNLEWSADSKEWIDSVRTIH